MGGPQSRSRRGGENRNVSIGNQISVAQTEYVNILTELSRLLGVVKSADYKCVCMCGRVCVCVYNERVIFGIKRGEKIRNLF
jgi:hypothetical protein